MDKDENVKNLLNIHNNQKLIENWLFLIDEEIDNQGLINLTFLLIQCTGIQPEFSTHISHPILTDKLSTASNGHSIFYNNYINVMYAEV